MTGTNLNNDRFPTDPYQLLLALAACAALSLAFPTDQVQSFTGLLSVAIALLPRR